MLQSFQVESYKGERPIIIYGTSITAKIICYIEENTFHLLQDLN